ncbi:quinon protein alcohol dehydrogenase-like superfamily [Ilyonectria sp. MPI-CAGE-AT-0026]|nr:quinon protein alcohol dehydrogenase-like superfamily [Ilyonectria sp. MPI-CAGE-AT-0026]
MVYQKYWTDQKLACIKAVSGVQTHFYPCLQTLEAHQQTITALAVSGNAIASTGGNQLKLWDSRTGIHRQTFECTGHLMAIAFMSDGNKLVSISIVGEIQMWDLSTGNATSLQANPVHGRMIGCAAFSPDCSLLATVTRYVLYKVDWWNLKTGVHSHTVDDLGQIIHIAYSPDGSVVALSSYLRELIYLVHAATGILKKEFRRHTFITAFSPDGNTLLIPKKGFIEGLDIASGTLQVLIADPRIAYHPLEFLGGGRLILAHDRNLVVWDMTANANRLSPEGELTCSALSQDGKYFALALPNGEVSLRNPATDAQYWSVRSVEKDSVHMLAFSPNGKILATASIFGSISLLDTETSAVRVQFNLDQFGRHWSRQENTIAVSSNGKTLAAATVRGSVKLWNLGTGAHIRTFRHTDFERTMVFSDDGQHLLMDDEPMAIHSDSGDNPKLRGRQILVSGDWITRDGKAFLWLPEEYRPKCEASDGSRLVLVVNRRGRAICFDFDLALLDSSPI